MHDIPADREAPHYVAERIKRKLVEDDRCGELGIRVDVHGPDVYLRGRVDSEQRRALVAQIATEDHPALRVHNEIDVVEVGDPGAEERLS